MYKDLKNSPFYNGERKASPDNFDPFNGWNNVDIDPQIRYGFATMDNVSDSQFDFQSAEAKEREYKLKQPVNKKTVTLTNYNDEHFFEHEEECEVCDYIEMFQNADAQKIKEMFVFSEVIGKPKALKKFK